jgi:mannose-1-phosphate guanylyltransferase
MNGDIMCDVDVSKLVAFHKSHGAEGTLHLTPVEDPSQYGVVELNEAGWVQRFVEKPAPGDTTSNVVNAGTYVLEPSVLNRIPEGQRLSIERVVFPAMVLEGTLAAMATDDYWIDTGLPSTYLRANLDLIDGTRSRILASVGPQAHVHSSASITHSVIGEAAIVEEGCVIIDSVVLPGAHIGARVRLERSLVMGSIGAESSLTDCVVGADVHVAPFSQLVDAKVPDPASVV